MKLDEFVNLAQTTAAQMAIADVLEEIVAAIEKHGIENTPINPAMPTDRKLAILVEEIGEVARVICEYHHGRLTADLEQVELYDELKQVAAMAMAWMIGIRKA